MTSVSLILLFVFNFVIALGMKVFANEETANKWFGKRVYQIGFLIPPIAIVVAGLVLLYGILYSLYITISFYFSDNK